MIYIKRIERLHLTWTRMPCEHRRPKFPDHKCTNYATYEVNGTKLCDHHVGKTLLSMLNEKGLIKKLKFHFMGDKCDHKIAWSTSKGPHRKHLTEQPEKCRQRVSYEIDGKKYCSFHSTFVLLDVYLNKKGSTYDYDTHSAYQRN